MSRIKILRMGGHGFSEILAGVRRVSSSDVPPDAQLIRARSHSHDTGNFLLDCLEQVDLVFEHPSFPEVAEGEERDFLNVRSVKES